MILDGKIVAKKIKEELKIYIQENKLMSKYVSIFLLGEDKPSEVYVTMKRAFGNDIGLDVKVFGNKKFENKENNISKTIENTDLLNINNLLLSIELLNKDEDCIGIIVQLPLPKELQNFKPQILAKISALKDIDGLGGSLMGISTIDYIDFLPGTPSSVINLLEYYSLANFEGKTVSIIGQSNLVGKPLAMEIIKRYGEVFSFNHRSDINLMKEICKKSDYIISATGKIHLIDETFLREEKDQILIDVGYGFLDGKAVGDINFENVKDKVKAISPVPGGVGPLTVACLFNNIKVINRQKHKLFGIVS